MIQIPSAFLARFDSYITKKQIPVNIRSLYKKWLRYYLDFCKKYHFGHSHHESLPKFLAKLEEKKQTTKQRQQAREAIELYHEFFRGENANSPLSSASQPPVRHDKASVSPPQSAENTKKNIFPPTSATARDKGDTPAKSNQLDDHRNRTFASLRNTQPETAAKTGSMKNASWKSEYKALEEEIKIRHYSPKTRRNIRVRSIYYVD